MRNPSMLKMPIQWDEHQEQQQHWNGIVQILKSRMNGRPHWQSSGHKCQPCINVRGYTTTESASTWGPSWRLPESLKIDNINNASQSGITTGKTYLLWMNGMWVKGMKSPLRIAVEFSPAPRVWFCTVASPTPKGKYCQVVGCQMHWNSIEGRTGEMTQVL